MEIYWKPCRIPVITAASRGGDRQFQGLGSRPVARGPTNHNEGTDFPRVSYICQGSQGPYVSAAWLHPFLGMIDVLVWKVFVDCAAPSVAG